MAFFSFGLLTGEIFIIISYAKKLKAKVREKHAKIFNC